MGYLIRRIVRWSRGVYGQAPVAGGRIWDQLTTAWELQTVAWDVPVDTWGGLLTDWESMAELWDMEGPSEWWKNVAALWTTISDNWKS